MNKREREKELLRCPFCGHKAHFGLSLFQSHIVSCNSCGARTISCENDDLAKRFWNRRKKEVTDER